MRIDKQLMNFVFLPFSAAERVARIEGSQQRSLRACWETIRDRTRWAQIACKTRDTLCTQPMDSVTPLKSNSHHQERKSNHD